MKKIIAIFLLTLCIAFTVFADEMDKISELYKKKEYKQAVILLKKIAKQGDARGQAGLGLLYARGEGVTQDYNEAVKWYKLSAKQGNLIGQNYLGVSYFHGNGVQIDYLEAIKWFKLASEQKNVTKRYISLQTEAQIYLAGICYAIAANTQDYQQAHMWFYIASLNADSEELRYQAQNGRSDTAAKMTPEQLENAQRLAQEWMKNHT